MTNNVSKLMELARIGAATVRDAFPDLFRNEQQEHPRPKKTIPKKRGKKKRPVKSSRLHWTQTPTGKVKMARVQRVAWRKRKQREKITQEHEATIAAS